MLLIATLSEEGNVFKVKTDLYVVEFKYDIISQVPILYYIC